MEKKNTVLLTIIAVAVLLVAVVGATFAYFTATSTGSKTQTVKVTTDTINESTFNPGTAITLNANLTNFGKAGEEYTGSNPGTQTGSNTATVKFKAGSKGSASMCYTAGLQITTNTFKKSSGFSSTEGPELNITVTKNGNPIYTKLEIIGSNFTSGILYYPLSSSTSANKNPVTHKITASKNSEVTDTWKTTLAFVYESDINQNTNAGSQFKGNIVFTKLNSCS